MSGVAGAECRVVQTRSSETRVPLVAAVVIAASSSPLAVLFVQEDGGVEQFTISDDFSMPFLSFVFVAPSKNRTLLPAHTANIYGVFKDENRYARR